MSTGNGHDVGDDAAVCAPRAEVFAGGVPFVRGWSAARRASSHLAGQLVEAGLAQEFGGLRPDVSVRGDGLVCIGPISTEAANRLTVLIGRGLCVEYERLLDRVEDSSAA